jgi:hypothetical protein
MTMNKLTGQQLAVMTINHVAQLHPVNTRNQQLMMAVGLLCQVMVDSAHIDDYTLQELMKLLQQDRNCDFFERP